MDNEEKNWRDIPNAHHRYDPALVNRFRSWWTLEYWYSNRTWQDRFKWYLQRFFGFWAPGVRLLGLLALVAGALGVRPVSQGLPFIPGWTEFYRTIVPELFGIGITVLLVDYANERRARRELLERLIREMGSTDNGIARRAVRELKAHDWLYDGSLRGADLWKANLQDADLNKADLRGAGLADANLQGAELFQANLQGANMVGANLQGAELWEANLQGAGLSEANLQGTFSLDANLQGAYLREANLEGADLGGANLRSAELHQATLQGASLWRANLQDANLKEATLQDVVLGSANLQNALVEKANLRGAELWGADLEGAESLTSEQLRQVKLLHGALMPDGKPYMGAFDLEEDRVYAKNAGVDINDPEALADWYRDQWEKTQELHKELGWLPKGDNEGRT